MAVDSETVVKVARLARLRLVPEEIPHLVGELNQILGWIDRLQAVDTEDVAPLDMVIENKRPWRTDEVTDGNCREAILANAPRAAHGFFAVPRVIE
ncbi:MAG: Asp-tRNA(Asn)/Glu-tRNA(Gln) amidotransferase subunit GatC [Sphingomonadaceae bacterium]